MKNYEILRRVIQSFLIALGRKTSQDFSIKTFDYIIRKYRDFYEFLEYLAVDIDSFDKSIIIKVEQASEIEYANRDKISDFLEIVFKEVFKEVIRDERFYGADLESIIEDVKNDVGDLLVELGVKIEGRFIVHGAYSEVKATDANVYVENYSKKSHLLKPFINSVIGLVYEGMLKKEKKRNDAIEVVVETIKELEKKYEFFGYMLLENIDKKQSDCNVKLQWTCEDVFFFDSNEPYVIKAVSKIDKIEDNDYAKAITEFILRVGSYINVQDKPFFIDRLKSFMDTKILKDFIEIGIDLDGIEESFKKQGYNDIIKRTFKALIEIIASKTSNNYAVAILDKLIDDMREMENSDLLEHITIDKSLYNKGIESINIDLKINNEDPYKISKFLAYILKKTQENRESYAEKASFIKDIQREMGNRYFAELDNMGVNVHLIDMRFI